MNSSEKKNKYAQRAGRSPRRKWANHTAKDFRDAGQEVGTDLLAGAIGGGFAGALAGRWSLLSGALLAYIGHLKKNRIAQAFGLGMMTSGGFTTIRASTQESVSGTEAGFVEMAKARFEAMRRNLGEKVFLDKLNTAVKRDDQATAGLGEVRYFNHSGEEERSRLDMSTLDELEAALYRSAADYSTRDVSGELPEDPDEPPIY